MVGRLDLEIVGLESGAGAGVGGSELRVEGVQEVGLACRHECG